MARILLLIPTCFCVAFWPICCAAQWPIPQTAAEAYRFANARRDDAEQLWRQKNPRGLQILQEVLSYLNQPAVRELAAENRSLAARKVNVWLDLAEAYAILPNPPQALLYLNKVAASYPDPALAKLLDNNPSFKTFHDNRDSKSPPLPP